MNWKEFLKPDFTKLFTFFIIEFITIAASTIPFILEILIPFNFIITSFTNLTSVTPTDFSTIQSMYVIFGLIRFLDLFWHYIISCFIVWIYRKLRGKKK